jgi:hypothetical protein
MVVEAADAGVVAAAEGDAVAAVGVVAVVAFPFLGEACPMDHQEVPFHHILHHHTLQGNLEEACQMAEALQNVEEAHQRVACQGVGLASCQEEAALYWAFHPLKRPSEKYV